MYRKFSADHIFSGRELLPDDRVLITSENGVVKDLVKREDAGDDIFHVQGMLVPGFVNAHCHLELSHLKGMIPEGTGLVDFVQQVMMKRAVQMEEKLAAMQDAQQEMRQKGIVAVGDICNTTDAIAVKQQGDLYWHHFIEVSGFVEAGATKRFADATETARQYSVMGQPVSLVPHAPYSVCRSLFRLISDATEGQLITIHNQESLEEDLLYTSKSGRFLELYRNFNIDISSFEPTKKTSLQSWLPYFDHQQKVISVHNTYSGETDIDFALEHSLSARNELYFCLCPIANHYIENAHPPVELLRKKNANLIIGTDSYASNHQLDILAEMKAISKHAHEEIPLTEMLQWATINGARALGMEDRLGSFEKGRQPGLVRINGLDGLKLTETATSERIL